MKYLYDGLDDAVSGIILLMMFAVMVIVLAIVFGMIGYFLISVAFPQYISFGWYWWKFIALGLLMMMV